MSVHYKFKAALEFSTVTFDGIHISVLDLKNAIIEQKKLAKNADSDLQIMNAQTKEVYSDDATLIPKNTSVIVARVPLADRKKSSGGGGGGPNQRSHQNRQLPPNSLPSAVSKGVDLTAMEGTEEEKIQAMMQQASADYDPSTYAKIRGANQHGRVPDRYRCYKCNQSGHWIKDCPSGGGMGFGGRSDDVKKSTGIPRSFMVPVDGPQVPGALITPEGRYAVPAVDHAAYLEKNKPVVQEPPVPKPKIPEELLCNLCQDLLTDALLVPCCANSYCDDCIRSALLESENLECPGCHEKDISPTSLIPNRFLRTAVNAFKNETGYSKPQKPVEQAVSRNAPPTVDLTLATPTEAPRKLSLDELPDDLFPHSPRKADQTDASDKKGKGDGEQDDKTDLYDFNDGSIPSPFASAGGNNIPDRHQESNFGSEGSSIPTFLEHGKQMGGGGRGSFHRTTRTPLHSEMPPIPTGIPLMRGEPPPPGFDDYPPGEERDSPHNRDERGRPHHMDDRSHNGPRGRMPMGMPGPGAMPFNTHQPPPGFNQMHPGMAPPMFGGPGPGPGPMHQNAPYPFQPHYRGGPPPRNFGPPPMYGPHPGDRYSSRDRGRRPPDYSMDRDRDRDDKDRPYRTEDKPKPVVENTLEEFERLMREKDRRRQMALEKQQQLVVPPKRSRSRSFSPRGRTPSPFLKRQRSPYSRSPSPKRKRILRRRNSFSRSKSRSPGVLRRPVVRSRSRNRTPSIPPIVAPPLQPKRRSPRRAPPYSPSPPPSSIPRIPPREKDEYFEKHPPLRYEPPRSNRRSFPREFDKYESSSKYDSGPGKYDSHSKYDAAASKYHESSYEGGSHKYDSRSSKYDSHSSKYDGGSEIKYEDRRDSRYESNRGPASSKYESSSSSGSKYDANPNAKYESTSMYDRKYIPSGGSKYEENPPKYDERDRDGPKKYERAAGVPRTYPHHNEPSSRIPSDTHRGRERDRERDRENRQPPPHDFETSVTATAGSEQFTDKGVTTVPVSLFDLKIAKPHGYSTPPNTTASHKHDEKRVEEKVTSYYNPGISPSRAAVVPEVKVKRERELDSVSASCSPDSEGKAHSHSSRRRKSGEEKDSPSKAEKKVKKEKKKHHKKKRDEKEKKVKRKKEKASATTTVKSEGDTEGGGTQETESDSGCSRRTSSETPLALGGVKSEMIAESLGSLQHAEVDVNVAVICDSTVKSPLHPSTGEHLEPLVAEEGMDIGLEKKEEANTTSELDNSSSKVKDKPCKSMDTEDSSVGIPPSKWDMYDEDQEEGAKSSFGELIPDTSQTEGENHTVTSEVLKRAENALFHKAISSIRPTEARKLSPRKDELDFKVEVDIQKEPEVKREARNTNSSIQITVASVSVAESKPVTTSSTTKRSVKDRLGSKVSEEHETTEQRSSRAESNDRSMMKSQVSVTRSGEKDREKDRERRRRSRSRSPLRLREKDSRHDSRESRMIIQLRPRSRPRSPLVRNRDERYRGGRRSRSRSRPRLRLSSPVRAPLVLGRRRSRSPRNPRRRSPTPERRRRDDSDNRNRRDQERDRDRKDKPREEAKPLANIPQEEREPSPPGVSPRALAKAEEEENWKMNSDKFVPIGFAPVVVERSYTPPPLGQELKKAQHSAPIPLSIRKQKGRINIKLSSTSKAEENSSSSSSDEDAKSSVKVRSSIEESESEKKRKREKREKKKAKRRKSNSSSSSSSDSDVKKKHKAKKKKKKKSKKKKSK